MNPLKLTGAQIDGLRSCRHRRRTGRKGGGEKGKGSRLSMMRRLKRMGLIYFAIFYAEPVGHWYLNTAGLLIIDLLDCPDGKGK